MVGSGERGSRSRDGNRRRGSGEGKDDLTRVREAGRLSRGLGRPWWRGRRRRVPGEVG